MNTDFETAERKLNVEASSHRAATIDLIDLVIALARRKQFILFSTVAFGVITALASLFVPNRFAANASLLPPEQTQSSASMLLNQLSGGALGMLAGNGLGLKNPSELYVDLMRSRTCEDAIIVRFELQKQYRTKTPEETRRELENHTDILVNKEGIIGITVEDRDPSKAAAIANAYIEELKQLLQNISTDEAVQRRNFYEQRMDQAKTDLNNAEVNLKNVQQRTGAIHLDNQAKAVIEAVGTLRAEITAKEVQLQAMRISMTPENVEVLRTQKELTALRAELQKSETQSSGESDPLMATAKLPAVGLEYVRAMREVKYRELLFELLAKQYESAKLDEGKQAALVQVVDKAVPPHKKSGPKRGLWTLTAIFLAFFGSVFVVSFQTFLAHTDEGTRQRIGDLKAALLKTDSVTWRDRTRG
jgi:tyrosine-protein kinase Etk/Wzc